MLSLLGPILGGLFGMLGASKAAKAQSNAANQMTGVAQQNLDWQKQLYGEAAPFREGGMDALAGMLYELGLGPKPEGYTGQAAAAGDAFNMQQGRAGEAGLAGLMFELGLGPRPENYQGYQKSQGYDFRMQQGQNALEASAAARGGLYSGATGTALNQYAQGVANQDYNQYLGGLGGMVGLGQTGYNQLQQNRNNYLSQLYGLTGMGQAGAQTASAGVANASGQLADAFGAKGNAQSAGWLGAVNALNTGIGNIYGVQQYNNALAAYQ